MPVKLPAPVAGTAEQAEPKGAEALVALPAEPVLAAAIEVLDVAAAAGLLELLLHALALTAIAAEHNRTAAVLLRVENIFSSLIQGCMGAVDEWYSELGPIRIGRVFS
nr:hypothetical protein [Catenulispora rubra]